MQKVQNEERITNFYAGFISLLIVGNMYAF